MTVNTLQARVQKICKKYQTMPLTVDTLQARVQRIGNTFDANGVSLTTTKWAQRGCMLDEYFANDSVSGDEENSWQTSSETITAKMI